MIKKYCFFRSLSEMGVMLTMLTTGMRPGTGIVPPQPGLDLFHLFFGLFKGGLALISTACWFIVHSFIIIIGLLFLIFLLNQIMYCLSPLNGAVFSRLI